MRKLPVMLLLTALLGGSVASLPALAHGNTEPQFGGIVKIVGEYSFELKQEADSVKVWVFYDGEPLNASELKLHLKIKGDNRKELVEVTAANGNLFSGPVKLHTGEKVLAMLTLQDGVSKIVGKYML